MYNDHPQTVNGMIELAIEYLRDDGIEPYKYDAYTIKQIAEQIKEMDLVEYLDDYDLQQSIKSVGISLYIRRWIGLGYLRNKN
jgi:hypothetical protein